MNYNDRLDTIQRREIGYKEHSDGWTKYGEWYAENIAKHESFATADWCAMYLTWCMAQASVPKGSWPFTSPQGSEVNYLANWLESKGYRTPPDDMPKVGDIVLYSWSFQDNNLDHVGRVLNVSGSNPDNAILTVNEGNCKNEVANRTIAYRDNRVRKTFRIPQLSKACFPSLSFMLRRGDNGYAVELLQAALIIHGYDIYGGVDGYFGNETEKALRRYQTDVDIIVDGKAGAEVFGCLMGV